MSSIRVTHARTLSVLVALSVALGCAGPSAARSGSAAFVRQGQEGAAATLVQRGRQAWQTGDGVRAEQYFTLAIERGYDQSKLLPVLLEVCLSNSRLRAALNHALPYLRQHPDDLALSYLVATIQLGLGQQEQAKRELVALLRQAPRHADAHYLLGVVTVDNDATAAAQHFHRYLELAPTGARASEVKRRLSDLQLDRKEATHTVSLLGARGYL